MALVSRAWFCGARHAIPTYQPNCLKQAEEKQRGGVRNQQVTQRRGEQEQGEREEWELWGGEKRVVVITLVRQGGWEGGGREWGRGDWSADKLEQNRTRFPLNEPQLCVRRLLLLFLGCSTSQQHAEHISATDLLTQFDVLPHRKKSRRSNLLPINNNNYSNNDDDNDDDNNKNRTERRKSRFFFTVSSQCCELSRAPWRNRVQITCNT